MDMSSFPAALIGSKSLMENRAENNETNALFRDNVEHNKKYMAFTSMTLPMDSAGNSKHTSGKFFNETLLLNKNNHERY